MRSVLVVIGYILLDYPVQLLLTEVQGLIQTLPFETAHETLADGISFGGSVGRSQFMDPR